MRASRLASTSGWPFERQARGPGIRLAQRKEVRASTAVGDSGDIGLRLVDVVLPLHAIEQREDVVHLADVPPGVLIGGLRLDVNLRLAGDARRLRLPSRLRRTCGGTVQLPAERPLLRGCVVVGT